MNVKLKILIPTMLFVGTSLLIWLLDLGWFIVMDDPAVQDYVERVYLMPIILSVNLIFPIYYIYQHQDKFNLPEKPPKLDFKKFLVYMIVFYVGIMIFRQLILWKYTLPFEKIPIIIWLVLHILLIEKISLDHYGLHHNTWKKDLKFVFIYIGILVLLVVPAILILIIIIWEQWLIVVPQLAPPNILLLASFPYQMLAVGLSEELVFRGYMYGNLRMFSMERDRFNRIWLIIFISCVIFGLFHVPWYFEFSPTTLIYLPSENVIPLITRVVSTGIGGLFFCLFYEHTRSLLVCMILHGLWNAGGAYLGSVFLYVDINTINFSAIPTSTYVIAGVFLISFLIFFMIIALKLPGWLGKKLNYELNLQKYLEKVVVKEELDFRP